MIALIAVGVLLVVILFIPWTRHVFLHVLGHVLEHTVGHFWEKHERGFEMFLIVGAWVVLVGTVLLVGILGIVGYFGIAFFRGVP
jgi:amino acid transporter